MIVGPHLIRFKVPSLVYPKLLNRSQGCKVRRASDHLIVSVYRVPQMQGVGCADVLLYFKCSTTQQMPCSVNAYQTTVTYWTKVQ